MTARAAMAAVVRRMLSVLLLTVKALGVVNEGRERFS